MGLADGVYTFYVKAINLAGNETVPPATQAFTVKLGSDLIETSVTNPPLIATRLSGLSITDTVKNQGGVEAGPSTTRYYLSTDQGRDGGDKRLIGGHQVPSLPPGGTNTKGVTVTIPFNTQLGTYYLLACADDTNKVVESDENNNCLASTSTIQVIGR